MIMRYEFSFSKDPKDYFYKKDRLVWFIYASDSL